MEGEKQTCHLWAE